MPTTPILKFYHSVLDAFLLYAVIITRYKNTWVLCKHSERDTYEIPGGKREIGETILATAKRELYEETGATKYTIAPFMPYSVMQEKKESFGMIFIAEVDVFDALPALEIEKIVFWDVLPPDSFWTYSTLQPLMIEKYLEESNNEA